jgi:hypothetical protein
MREIESSFVCSCTSRANKPEHFLQIDYLGQGCTSRRYWGIVSSSLRVGIKKKITITFSFVVQSSRSIRSSIILKDDDYKI